MFTQSLIMLHSPVNTAVDFRIGADRGRSRNQLVEASLERGSEWMLFLDDDHTFPPGLLLQLLSHDQPVVASLYLQRTDPFLPIAYMSKDEEANYWPLDLNDCNQFGLVPVVGAGTGGMLIRSEILRAMQYPWFEHGRASEDLLFCDKVYELGLGPVYCDLSARMGHLTFSSIWPTHSGDDWSIGFTVSDGCNLTVPWASVPDKVDEESGETVAA